MEISLQAALVSIPNFGKVPRTPPKRGYKLKTYLVLFFMAQTLDGGGKVVVGSYHVR